MLQQQPLLACQAHSLLLFPILIQAHLFGCRRVLKLRARMGQWGCESYRQISWLESWMSCVTKLTLQSDAIVFMPRLGKLIQVNFLMLSAHLCWGARLLWISSSTKVFDYQVVRLTSEREIGISVVSQAGLLWEMVVIDEMGCAILFDLARRQKSWEMLPFWALTLACKARTLNCSCSLVYSKPLENLSIPRLNLLV